MYRNLPYLHISSSSSQSKVDLLVRIGESETGAGHYDIKAIAETRRVVGPIRKLLSENSVLKIALRNQWHIHNYNQEYNSFLLGTYTREEFLDIARQYARPFSQIDKDQLEQAAHVIIETLGETVSSDDLSQLLNVDPSDIEIVLPTSPYFQVDIGSESQDD